VTTTDPFELASCPKDSFCPQFLAASGADGPGKLVSPQIAARRVAAIIGQTQTTETARHRPEPMGEIISVDLELIGLRGRPVYLGWSIYPSNGRTSLYGKWLDRFVAYQLEATTDDDTGTAEVWVPLPKGTGSYFVRFTLSTDGSDLNSDDSGSFS
jgi:hypothetical protein